MDPITHIEDIYDRMHHIFVNDAHLDRIHAQITSLETRHAENEASISRIETPIRENIKQKEELLRVKSRVEILNGAKSGLGSLRSGLEWLAHDYPQVADMTVIQAMAFIDSIRDELRTRHDNLRGKIRALSQSEAKYNLLLQKRERLTGQINTKRNEYNDQLTHASSLRKDLYDLQVLGKMTREFNI